MDWHGNNMGLVVVTKKKYFIRQITDNNEQLKYTTFGGLPVKHKLIIIIIISIRTKSTNTEKQ